MGQDVAVTVLQVLFLVAGILLLQLLLWIPVLFWMRRRSAAFTSKLCAEIEAAGERVVLGPHSGVYRGGTGPFPRVKGNGVVALGDRHLWIRKLIGRGLEVPVEEIVRVREARWFLRSLAGNQMHVIVELRSGNEIGFFVRQREEWVSTLRSIAGAVTPSHQNASP